MMPNKDAVRWPGSGVMGQGVGMMWSEHGFSGPEIKNAGISGRRRAEARKPSV